ncbi:nitric oxide synthase oxygenase [Streptomyces sp. RKND-216]|uniref:nitric oxide synthase oxygenase n=1 Tax=Streptomyces sp. RKND-216 TaxID=2562581 RepID=UPI00109DC888|nr:nitric oxide synthase oxygenase [Streptomyces sp. RKND-216]THA25990.1 nitric oxide synthase oxygenase [Streptomyces sp. RKND-216]
MHADPPFRGFPAQRLPSGWEAPPVAAAPASWGHAEGGFPGGGFAGGGHGDRPANPGGGQAGTAPHTGAEGTGVVDRAEAEDFLRLFYTEQPDQPVTFARRLYQIRAEVESTGTYAHTFEELAFGARVAWRNSARCIGRLYWNSLQVRDLRHVTAPDHIFAELCEHLRLAANGGRVRPVISVFAPDAPGRPGPRVWNDQLVRYAGHRRWDGGVDGDPGYTAFTEQLRRMGWQPQGTTHDLLPLVIDTPDDKPQMFDVPREVVLEIPLSHPDYPWFARLGLRWYAVPAISHMRMRVGGVDYGLAPFNGWYMGTEIGARNFVDADRYDLLPVVAREMGLDTRKESSLWKDRALVEINVAVLHSFETAGVKITDHHTESQRFLTHLAKEERQGRTVPTDWSWIVPPLSGGVTPVFHRYYDEGDLRPNFYLDPSARARSRGECPFGH